MLFVRRVFAARVRAITLSCLLSLLAPAAMPAIAAAMPACDGIDNGSERFAGNARAQANTRGVYAEIEWFNSGLCVQTGSLEPSWSMSWVSIEGSDSDADGVEIYQGGFTKCAVVGTGSCAFNGGVSYHFYFYGREEGTCGAAYNSGVVKASMGNAGPGTYEYEISKFANGSYVFSINHVSQVSKTAWAIETCWGAVSRVEWQNENLDPNDQNGGTLSNHQVFDNIKYRNLTGWYSYVQPTSQPCQANSNPVSWRCFYGSTNGNQFYEWDVRVP